MKNSKILRRTFVRQREEKDCGIACVYMILNYAGHAKNASQLYKMPIPDDGLTLADLKALSVKMGLPGRAVEMNLSDLADLNAPCILHIKTMQQELHYVVCYGSRKKGTNRQYLIADPARYFIYVDEQLLSERWQTRTALYFENVLPNLNTFGKPLWSKLWKFKNFPNGILFSIPLLTVIGTSTGIASSWLLQKGLFDSTILSGHIIVPILILLSIIIFSRCLIAYLKQRILINLNIALNSQLMKYLLDSLFYEKETPQQYYSSINLKQTFADIQSITNAISFLIGGLCSDGMLSVIILTSLFFYLPAAALINIVYLMVVILLINKNVITSRFKNRTIARLMANVEQSLVKDANQLSQINSAELESRKLFHRQNHLLPLRYSQLVAISATRNALWLDALGAINIIIVLIICLYTERKEGISYEGFMLIVILSYLISSLVPKLANSILVIADGAEAALQFSYMVGNSE